MTSIMVSLRLLSSLHLVDVLPKPVDSKIYTESGRLIDPYTTKMTHDTERHVSFKEFALNTV